jgi:2-aminoethylphosphonate-pyruvate transaminase
MLLLNPGPVTLSERVRRSLLQPDLCHREPEFFDLQDDARRRLLAVYDLDPAEWAAVLLTGSGTAAVESMITSLVPLDGKVLIASNGVYGERMADMAARQRLDRRVMAEPWVAGLDLARIAAILDADPTITHVATVHHETTTGRLNDLAALAEVCQTRNVHMLVDAVSSFGGEPIPFADHGLAAVAATANKCLHGVPGAAFVLVRRTALERGVSRAYYLDLVALAREQDRRGTPFTPAVHAYYALVEALAETAQEGGWPARNKRYLKHGQRVADALRQLGVEPLLPDEECSAVLRAFRLPATGGYPELHDKLKAAGFVIYAGQGPLAQDMFRISVMGDVRDADVDRLTTVLRKVLADAGRDIT